MNRLYNQQIAGRQKSPCCSKEAVSESLRPSAWPLLRNFPKQSGDFPISRFFLNFADFLDFPLDFCRTSRYNR